MDEIAKEIRLKRVVTIAEYGFIFEMLSVILNLCLNIRILRIELVLFC